jgi:hypothetical protein
LCSSAVLCSKLQLGRSRAHNHCRKHTLERAYRAWAAAAANRRAQSHRAAMAERQRRHGTAVAARLALRRWRCATSRCTTARKRGAAANAELAAKLLHLCWRVRLVAPT